ncbi:hypothetical protein AtEden1_Chr2g0227461 [Arabidopsis thaliana]
METLAIHTRTCESVVSGFEKELIRLENELQGCKMELREMKNLLVTVVVSWFLVVVCIKC